MTEIPSNKIKRFSLKSLNVIIKLFFGEEYFKSRIVGVLFFACFLVNIIDWLALVIFLKPPAGTVVILHYNVYFGSDMIGEARRAYFLPLLGLIVLAINLPLSIYFYKLKERIATYVFLITALSVQLSLLISIISVIIVNY